MVKEWDVWSENFRVLGYDHVSKWGKIEEKFIRVKEAKEPRGQDVE